MEIKSNKSNILLICCLNFVFIFVSGVIVLSVGNNLQAAFSQGYIPPPPPPSSSPPSSFSSPLQNNIQSQPIQQCPQVSILGPSYLGPDGCPKPCPNSGDIPSECQINNPNQTPSTTASDSTENNLGNTLLGNNNPNFNNNNPNFNRDLKSSSLISPLENKNMSNLNTLTASRCAINISGKWSGNDGGDYYIRQIGNDIWWVGTNIFHGIDATGTFSNVFHGDRNGLDITGKWQDVPLGHTKGSGDISLSIDPSGEKITKKTSTGGFAGTEWTKAC